MQSFIYRVNWLCTTARIINTCAELCRTLITCLYFIRPVIQSLFIVHICIYLFCVVHTVYTTCSLYTLTNKQFWFSESESDYVNPEDWGWEITGFTKLCIATDELHSITIDLHWYFITYIIWLLRVWVYLIQMCNMCNSIWLHDIYISLSCQLT